MNSIDRKNREREIRRNDIIDAAIQLFYEKGYNGTTMDDIAGRAEFTKMTVYSYFSGKEEILLSAAIKSFRILNEMFTVAGESGSSGFDKITGIGMAYCDFFLNHRPNFRILDMTGSTLQGMIPTPPFAEFMEENNRMIGIMSRAIAEGISDGTLRKDIEPRQFALLLVSFSNGFYKIIDSYGDMFPPQFGASAEEFVELGLTFIGNAIKDIRLEKA
jgi:AcrR family transcriptional regulator